MKIKKGISATCTCPYDWEGYCNHIVATLLAMLEDRVVIESMVEASTEKQQSMDALLARVEPEALRNILRREMERLPELQARFIACFSTKSKGKSLTDYKKDFQRKEADFLWPPSGDNLFAVLKAHKNLRDKASQIFEPFRLKLVFRLQENNDERRRLVQISPDLEGWVLNRARKNKIYPTDYDLPDDPHELHSIPRLDKRKNFQNFLKSLIEKDEEIVSLKKWLKDY